MSGDLWGRGDFHSPEWQKRWGPWAHMWDPCPALWPLFWVVFICLVTRCTSGLQFWSSGKRAYGSNGYVPVQVRLLVLRTLSTCLCVKWPSWLQTLLVSSRPFYLYCGNLLLANSLVSTQRPFCLLSMEFQWGRWNPWRPCISLRAKEELGVLA